MQHSATEPTFSSTYEIVPPSPQLVLKPPVPLPVPGPLRGSAHLLGFAGPFSAAAASGCLLFSFLVF